MLQKSLTLVHSMILSYGDKLSFSAKFFVQYTAISIQEQVIFLWVWYLLEHDFIYTFHANWICRLNFNTIATNYGHMKAKSLILCGPNSLGLTVPKWVLIVWPKYPECPRIYRSNLSAQAQKFWISMEKDFIGHPSSVTIAIGGVYSLFNCCIGLVKKKELQILHFLLVCNVFN